MQMVLNVVVAVLALQAAPVAKAQNPAAEARQGSLDDLRGRTGWIFLGTVTADRQRWSSGADPYKDYLTGTFEFVDRVTDRRVPIIPKPDEQIRLTTDVDVIIVNYRLTGEDKALVDPSSVPRSTTGSERTNILLPKNSILRVRDVRISPAYGDFRIVWARVVPADSTIQ